MQGLPEPVHEPRGDRRMPPWGYFLSIVNVSALGWIAQVAGWSFLLLMAVIATG